MTEHGIDTSNNNDHPIDWASVARSGVTFAWAKATEGSGFIDKYYVGDVEAMRAAGISPGAYHFAHPKDSPIQQARFFTSIVKQAPVDRVALDLELAEGLFANNLSQWCVDFLTELAVQLPGVEQWFYSYRSFIDNNLGDYANRLTGARIWLAAYQTDCPNFSPWPAPDMWQHSEHAAVPGVPGSCDENIAFLPLTGGTADDQVTETIMGVPVSVSDEDGRKAIADRLFEMDLGREPTVSDEQFWADRIADHGISFVVKAIYDSAEATNYRKAHGQ